MVIAFAAVVALPGCEDPQYDLSTPDLAIDSMQQMIEDGHPERLVQVVHIQARDLTFADGITEASAIEDVKTKLADLLEQLYRVSIKLNEKFPDEVVEQTEFARSELGFIYGASLEKWMSEVLRDPFDFVSAQRDRLTTIETEDAGRPIAAILWDDQPALAEIGLQMVEVDGEWKVEVPVDMPPISEYRPETREEWRVLANLMLAFENSLIDFEDRLDRNDFHSLAEASAAAGRMLGESAFIQGAIYSMMKRESQQRQ